MIYFQFPDIRPKALRHSLDWAGSFTLIGCIVPLLLALTWVTDYGWTSTRVESLLALAVLMLAAFLRAESKAPEPLLPLSLFREPVVRVSSICVFLLGMGMFGVIMYLPLFMQGVMNVSATESGGLLTPMMLGTVCGTFLGGQATYRLKGYKIPGVLGSTLVAEGSNEIPAGRQQLAKLDLVGKIVLSDAAHTQVAHARQILYEQGGNYLMTVKRNQKELFETLETLFTKQRFSPSAHGTNPRDDPRDQPGATRNPGAGWPGCVPPAGGLPRSSDHCPAPATHPPPGQEEH